MPESEFYPPGVWQAEISRRQFLKLAGGLAGLGLAHILTGIAPLGSFLYCNIVGKHFLRGSPVKALFRAVVNLPNNVIQLFLGKLFKAGAFGKVTPQQAIDVFIGASLTGAVGIGKEDPHSQSLGQLFVFDKL